MNYEPITEKTKNAWVQWLESQVAVLNGKAEGGQNYIFETPEGDVSTGKDLVGNLLATLTGKTITIN